MNTATVLVGNVLTRLKELPDESVHMVVTSPPYWGLRDYGTGTWEGGDEECDHIKGEMRRGVNLAASVHNTRGGAIKCAEVDDTPFFQVCGKCGATRLDDQIGLEPTPAEYLAKLVAVFREVRRVLRSDGTCWVNMGDLYSSQPNQRVQKNGGRDDVAGWKQATNNGSCGVGSRHVPGLKPKDLCGMPWRLAFALQDDGWWLRQDIIWHKPNPMPESVQDRCTKSHEYIFLLSKSEVYFYDAEAIREKVNGNSHARGNGINPKATKEGQHSRMSFDRDPCHTGSESNGVGWGYADGKERKPRSKQNESFSGSINELVTKRNKRSVWTIATQSYKEAHFATFPEELPENCILAGTSAKGACEKCGAPWERIMSEATGGMKGQSYHDHSDDLVLGARSNHGAAVFATYVPGETIGWKPTCECGAGVVPCTVLDPFSGAATTGLVALQNRCNYIGVELRQEYADMGNRRMEPVLMQGILV